MDFVSVIEIGLASGLFTVVGSLITLNFLKRRLINEVTEYFEQYIVSFAQNLKEHPEVAAGWIKPMLPTLFKELMPPSDGKEGENGSGGLMDLGLNFLPKKYRGIAAIAMQFLGNKSGNTQQSSNQPSSGQKSPFS